MYDLSILDLLQESVCLIRNKRSQKTENRQKTEDTHAQKSKTRKI